MSDDLRESLAEDIRELGCYTPDYFRGKWDHDGIIARLDKVHEALLDVADAAGEARQVSFVYYSPRTARLNVALDRLEEVRRDL